MYLGLAGIADGHTIEFQGMGLPSRDKGGPPGNLMVEIEVQPHEVFQRDGLDVHVEVKVDFVDAILGGTVRQDTIHTDAWALACQ